jgi:hypothetical protein
LRFFTHNAPFAALQPAPDVIAAADWAAGARPLALASADRATIVVYLPVGGTVRVVRGRDNNCIAQWFDPRSGALQTALPVSGEQGLVFTAPVATDDSGHPADWTLLMRAGE